MLLSILFTLLTVAVLLIGFALGWARRTRRALVKFGATSLSVLLALVAAKLIGKAAFAGGVKYSGETAAQLGSLLEKSAALKNLAVLVAGGILIPVIFALLFIVIRLVACIPSVIISSAIKKKESPEYSSAAYHKLIGGALGAISLFLGVTAVFFPIAVASDVTTELLSAYRPVYVAVKSISENKKTDSAGDLSGDALISAAEQSAGNALKSGFKAADYLFNGSRSLRKNPLIRLRSALITRPWVRFISGVETDGNTEDIYTLVDMLASIPESGIDKLITAAESGGRIELTDLDPAFDALGRLCDSGTFVSAVSDLLSEAGKAWKSGDDFLGVKSPLPEEDEFKEEFAGRLSGSLVDYAAAATSASLTEDIETLSRAGRRVTGVASLSDALTDFFASEDKTERASDLLSPDFSAVLTAASDDGTVSGALKILSGSDGLRKFVPIIVESINRLWNSVLSDVTREDCGLWGTEVDAAKFGALTGDELAAEFDKYDEIAGYMGSFVRSFPENGLWSGNISDFDAASLGKGVEAMNVTVGFKEMAKKFIDVLFRSLLAGEGGIDGESAADAFGKTLSGDPGDFERSLNALMDLTKLILLMSKDEIDEDEVSKCFARLAENMDAPVAATVKTALSPKLFSGFAGEKTAEKLTDMICDVCDGLASRDKLTSDEALDEARAFICVYYVAYELKKADGTKSIFGGRLKGAEQTVDVICDSAIMRDAVVSLAAGENGETVVNPLEITFTLTSGDVSAVSEALDKRAATHPDDGKDLVPSVAALFGMKK